MVYAGGRHPAGRPCKRLWSQKRPGVDERLDDGTTDIDTLDAFEYTIERDYRRLTAR